MGVKYENEDDIIIGTTDDGSARIQFKWTYPGTGVEKLYTITFIKADISNPPAYPQELHDVLGNKIKTLEKRGLIKISPREIRFTDLGKVWSGGVIRYLLGGLNSLRMNYSMLAKEPMSRLLSRIRGPLPGSKTSVGS